MDASLELQLLLFAFQNLRYLSLGREFKSWEISNVPAYKSKSEPFNFRGLSPKTRFFPSPCSCICNPVSGTMTSNHLRIVHRIDPQKSFFKKKKVHQETISFAKF